MFERTVAVTTREELAAAIDQVAIPGRAIALIGGADFTEAELLPAIRSFLGVLARHADASGTAVVDGGTDSGVMRLLGEARAEATAGFALVGVAPAGVFDDPARTGGPILPAPGHSLLVLVPGTRFGDEDDWLFAAADHLNLGPAPTVVVNGGRLTMDEAVARIGLGHPVIAVAGSGRAADELAGDADLRSSGRLRVVPISAEVAEVAAAIEGERGE